MTPASPPPPAPPAPGRLLAVDYGSKRVGLAISDPERRLATPYDTLDRKDDRGVVRQLRRLVEREGVTGFVVGEPRRLDGTRGDAARRATRFAHRLGDETGLPVRLIDEALTSVEAERRLAAAGFDPRADPGRVDATAAQILLEEALRTVPGDGLPIDTRHEAKHEEKEENEETP